MAIVAHGVRLVGRSLVVLSAAFLATACAHGPSPAPKAEPEKMGKEEDRLGPGQHTAMVDGMPIVYHVHGQGPVVLAHSGGPGCGWSYLRMPEVEQFATIVYIEPIGTGASGRLADPAQYSRQLDTANVEGLRAHLGIQKITLLGHSYGGFVALTYALTYPDHVRALILYDTAPMSGPERQKDVVANMEWSRNEPWFADAKSAFDDEDRAQSDEEQTRIFARAVPFYIANWSKRRHELEGKLPSIQIFVERSHRQKAGVPQVEVPSQRLVVLPNIGHLAHLEAPQEHARIIKDFLTQLE
ncbi:alpha/beta hydrolase [Pendulispora rubella]|uniref:Alpha/beta hydrolase n=1 Tax=Pendulispora rubella TaxID=2741070 RepID=A0ABZ2L6A9_9BACT